MESVQLSDPEPEDVVDAWHNLNEFDNAASSSWLIADNAVPANEPWVAAGDNATPKVDGTAIEEHDSFEPIPSISPILSPSSDPAVMSVLGPPQLEEHMDSIDFDANQLSPAFGNHGAARKPSPLLPFQAMRSSWDASSNPPSSEPSPLASPSFGPSSLSSSASSSRKPRPNSAPKSIDPSAFRLLNEPSSSSSSSSLLEELKSEHPLPPLPPRPPSSTGRASINQDKDATLPKTKSHPASASEKDASRPSSASRKAVQFANSDDISMFSPSQNIENMSAPLPKASQNRTLDQKDSRKPSSSKPSSIPSVSLFSSILPSAFNEPSAEFFLPEPEVNRARQRRTEKKIAKIRDKAAALAEPSSDSGSENDDGESKQKQQKQNASEQFAVKYQEKVLKLREKSAQEIEEEDRQLKESLQKEQEEFAALQAQRWSEFKHKQVVTRDALIPLSESIQKESEERRAALLEQERIHMMQVRRTYMQEKERLRIILEGQNASIAESLNDVNDSEAEAEEEEEVHLVGNDDDDNQKNKKTSFISSILKTKPPTSAGFNRKVRVQWDREPLPIQVDLIRIRGVRDKLPRGRYAVLVSIYDELGGKALAFSGTLPLPNNYSRDKDLEMGITATTSSSSGLKPQPPIIPGMTPITFPQFMPDLTDTFGGVTTPVSHAGHFTNVDLDISQSVRLICPSRLESHPENIIVFEVWALHSQEDGSGKAKAKNSIEKDRVIAWGAFPLLDGRFDVVRGRFRLPLIRGQVDPYLDRWELIDSALRDDIDNWLGNLYFDVQVLPRILPGEKIYEVDLVLPGDMLRTSATSASSHNRHRRNESIVVPDENDYSGVFPAHKQQVIIDEPLPQAQSSNSTILARRHKNGAVAVIEDRGEAVRLGLSPLLSSNPLEAPSAFSASLMSATSMLLARRPQNLLLPSTPQLRSHSIASGLFSPTKQSLNEEKKRLLSEPEEEEFHIGNANSHSDYNINQLDNALKNSVDPLLADNNSLAPPKNAKSARTVSFQVEDELSGLPRPITPLHEESQQLPVATPSKVRFDAAEEEKEQESAAVLMEPLFIRKTLLEKYRISVSPLKRSFTAAALAAEKMHFIIHTLRTSMGLRDSRTPLFWFMFLFILLVLWMRGFTHAAGHWIYVNSFHVPLIRQEWYSLGIVLDYRSEFLPGSVVVGSICAGSFFNQCLFIFLMGAAWASRRLLGSFPKPFSRFALAFGFGTAFDNILVLLVDVLSSSSVNGDSTRLYRHYAVTEGSGAMGIFITAVVFAILFASSSAILYQYALKLHDDGLMMDMYHRLTAPEKSFFVPHDLEVSLPELATICRTARDWRGADGSSRRVSVLRLHDKRPSLFLQRLHDLLTLNWPQQYFSRVRLVSFDLCQEVLQFARSASSSSSSSSSSTAASASTPMRSNSSSVDPSFSFSANLMTRQQSNVASERNFADLEVRQLLEEDDIRSALLRYFAEDRGSSNSQKPAFWVLSSASGSKPVESDSESSSSLITIIDPQLMADAIYFDSVEYSAQNRLSQLAKDLQLYGFTIVSQSFKSPSGSGNTGLDYAMKRLHDSNAKDKERSKKEEEEDGPNRIVIQHSRGLFHREHRNACISLDPVTTKQKPNQKIAENNNSNSATLSSMLVAIHDISVSGTPTLYRSFVRCPEGHACEIFARPCHGKKPRNLFSADDTEYWIFRSIQESSNLSVTIAGLAANASSASRNSAMRVEPASLNEVFA